MYYYGARLRACSIIIHYISKHCRGMEAKAFCLFITWQKGALGIKNFRICTAILLTAAICLCLCACGGDDGHIYDVIDTVGTKQYGTAFRLGDKAAAQVSAAMEVLSATGELSTISSGWLGEDLICLAGNADALSSLKDSSQSRTLIVGVETDLRPLSYPDEDGKYMGMSIDIAQAVGRLLGWEIKILPINADELSTQLSSGNIDCALGFGIEALSGDKYTLGPCYMQSDILIAVPAGSGIRSLRGLKGEKVGTVKDPSLIQALSADSKTANLADSATTYLSARRCISALENGWCAAVVMDRLMLQAYFK